MKLDVNSNEFKDEKEKTIEFVKNVHRKRGWVEHPDPEVNESVILGLTRNKLLYGIRYCPCFLVQGKTKEERKALNKRICPCIPAVKEEIPNIGKCHCGIYCTPEYAQKAGAELNAEVAAHSESRDLVCEECEALLKEEHIDGRDLEALLKGRANNEVDFILMDVRERSEWIEKRIEGADLLMPTSSIYLEVEKWEIPKDKPIIVYCFSGSRSLHVTKILKDRGYTRVVNLKRGIMSFEGKTVSGEK